MISGNDDEGLLFSKKITSNLVEGDNYTLQSGFEILVLYTCSFFFCGQKNMVKENKKAGSSGFYM